MKIGYVLRSLEDSGVTVYVLLLAQALRARGHDVFLVSDGGIYETEVQRLGLRHYHLPLCRGPLVSYLAARRLRPIVERERPAVLHANWRRAQLACHLASRATGVPFVSTLHLFGIPHSWFHRRLSYWGELVIAPCTEAFDYLRSTFGVPEDRVRLVYHGIDAAKWPLATPEARRAARRQFALDDDAPVAVCVGRLDWIKDHRILLAGFAAALARRPALRLLLVGAGPEDAALRRQAAELALGDRVLFLGRTDPHPALAAADLFILTSLHESFGFAPVEAMLTGLPVVRTAAEGARDQIRPGETGQIIPLADPAAVAHWLEDLADHRDLWHARGRAAHDDALTRFTLEAMVAKVEAVYDEVIKRS
jgi:glycosyltransferase involved in cell wall biosynthesis